MPAGLMSELSALFQRGDTADLLARTVDSADVRVAARDAAYVVGALAFQGRLEEAEAYYRDREAAFTEVDRAAARFFLGVGLCRQSRYASARGYFARNLREGAGGKPQLAFYAWQGLGFYRFFSGRFARAQVAARRAQHCAARTGSIWGHLLSTDLAGHCLVQTGEVSRGLKDLRAALGYARTLGNGGIARAIEVSIACAEAQHGRGDVAALERLSRRLAKSTQDTYSRSAVLLELARQYALRGRVGDARRSLNESCAQIYGARNRRHGVILNLRYARLALLGGEREQALNFVRNAARELDPGVDRALELEVRGLEVEILRELGERDRPELGERVAMLTAQTGKGVSRRILERARGAAPSARLGEDPIGDLLDRVRAQDAGERDARIAELAASGYLGLLPGALKAPRACVFFDALAGAVLVVDHGEVELQRLRLSQSTRRLARALFEGRALSKAMLVERAWGYRYRALDHGPLVHTHVSKLRRALGSRGSWIEVTEDGYRVNSQVEARFATAPKTPALPAPKPAGPELNYRQLQLLRTLRAGQFAHVPDHARAHGVSEITACRDLSDLARLGLLERVGRARATRYMLPNTEKSG